MLVIRKEQMDAFAKVGLKKFEAKMLAQFKDSYPEWAKAQGDQKLAEFIRHGVDRATRYGLKIELDVARYLHVMQSLGMKFDESERHPWARPMLERTDLLPADKIENLRDAVQYHQEAARIEAVAADPRRTRRVR
jgi:hypothetical protein